MINREHPERIYLVMKDKNGTKVDTAAYRDNWKTLRKQIDIMPGDLFFFTSPASFTDPTAKKKFKLLSKFKSKD